MMNDLISIAWYAGKAVLDIYQKNICPKVTKKTDYSPLTEADIASNEIILSALKKHYPDIPVVSEESKVIYPYEERKNWRNFFLIDPLDGTKEFIKRNNEFTINIALIHNNRPVMGVIHAPALELTYYAEKNQGAMKIIKGRSTKIFPSIPIENKLRVILSRSHTCRSEENFLKNLEAGGKKISVLTKGSALKFGLVAEGSADIYARFSPTMEWDTAAGQILVHEAGKVMLALDDKIELTYNKENLVNPGFIVE